MTKLTDELAELERKVDERSQKTDAIAEALAGFRSQVKKETVDLEALLLEEEPASAPKKSVTEDPFDFLNHLK
ncbi:hypothetical protein D3C73_1493640 [compost metagenome]